MLTLGTKIVVAIDGSPQSDKAAEEAVRLASVSGERFRSTVYAVFVLPPSQESMVIDYLPDDAGALKRPALQETKRRIFSVVEKAAGDAGIDLETLTLFGDPADEILRVAEEKSADVIVIGSTGKGRLRRALHGSTSAKVMHHSRCSVYVVR